MTTSAPTRAELARLDREYQLDAEAEYWAAVERRDEYSPAEPYSPCRIRPASGDVVNVNEKKIAPRPCRAGAH